jgi:acetyl-CoA acetyltransferase
MSDFIRDKTAIAGIGSSEFGRGLKESQLKLGLAAFKEALDDAGLTRDDIDGLSIHMGWPLGVDYDRIASAFGLELRYVNQSWTHGGFVTSALQHAALAVAAGLADCVACITAISFTRQRGLLGGPEDQQSTREEGGRHAEAPAYGLTSPATGAAMAMQRYMAQYGATSRELGEVAVTFRRHASRNPRAVARSLISLADHQASRMVMDPLRLYDCCNVTDGAACVLVTSTARARDLNTRPVTIAGMQSLRAGSEEFIFGPRGLGLNQQTTAPAPVRERDLEVYRSAGIDRDAIDGFYTYDAFSPLVLFALERFGFARTGEAASWIQGGRIGLGGELPTNTSGGLLSEAHVAGWNSITEMVRQLRGSAGETQIPGASVLQWGTCWGDSFILRN